MMTRPESASVAVVAMLACLLLAGCTKPPQPNQGKDEPVYDPRKDPLVNPTSLSEAAPDDLSKVATDETIFLELSGNPNTLNPLFGSSLVEFIVMDVLYDGLFTFDADMNWMVNEETVESFEESEDHTTFTVRIRPGIKWHDGQPFTAHDVVYSWKSILDENVPSQTHKPGTDEITECVAIDDLTVRFVQPKPLATRHWNLSFPIIPKHMFEKQQAEHPDLKTGDYYTKLARHPVGWGPYKIVEWVENQKVVVERWDDYHGEKPYFKRIVYQIIPDSNISLLSFEKGDVDVIRALSAEQFAKETVNSESFAKVGYKAWGPQWSFSYIGWNMDGSNPFFNDIDVRHAMTHALNLPLILEKV